MFTVFSIKLCSDMPFHFENTAKSSASLLCLTFTAKLYTYCGNCQTTRPQFLCPCKQVCWDGLMDSYFIQWVWSITTIWCKSQLFPEAFSEQINQLNQRNLAVWTTKFPVYLVALLSYLFIYCFQSLVFI